MLEKNLKEFKIEKNLEIVLGNKYNMIVEPVVLNVENSFSVPLENKVNKPAEYGLVVKTHKEDESFLDKIIIVDPFVRLPIIIGGKQFFRIIGRGNEINDQIIVKE